LQFVDADVTGSRTDEDGAHGDSKAGKNPHPFR